MTRLNDERITEIETKLASYVFKDHLGHSLTNCQDFQDLLAEVKALRVEKAQAEAERDVLVNVLDKGASDCPYLTFWVDGADLEIPDWCTCSDTDEYGFECNEDAKDCWLKYAQQQAEREGV